MTRRERLFCLQEYFSTEIMRMFSRGVPESLKNRSFIFEAEISYKEAEEILEYTISQLKDKPLKYS